MVAVVVVEIELGVVLGAVLGDGPVAGLAGVVARTGGASLTSLSEIGGQASS